jgi:hypothetical protein
VLNALTTRDEIIAAQYGAEVISTHTRKLAVSTDLTRVYVVDSRHWNDISIHVRVVEMPKE